ncbi:MAG TPA: DNA polymerase Y family protein [Polyangiaceae bacterium]|jgi:protein ImuB|nr:DNA polymerase Y family protein [Polyangiaceae bacterium]
MSAASPESAQPTRRVLALVLPELLCELAEKRLLWGLQLRKSKPPLGVVLVNAEAKPGSVEPKPIDATAKLSAVNESAKRYGVRAGQTIAEACALVANLVVREVTQAEVFSSLSCIAEVGLSLGTTVSVEAPDTVCVDITGSAHLQGGELALGSEFANRVRAMGHSVRVAISDGPRLASAFAHWFSPSAADPEDRGVCVVPSEHTRQAFAALPINALPLSEDSAGWFVRLGVFTIGELSALPRQALGSRLGEAAASVTELCAGRDRAPLIAFTPERTLTESSTWDEPVTGTEPLSFVLGGLVSRVSARLTGRGEAAQSLLLTIGCDPAIARFRGEKTELTLRFKLATPLHRADELRRVLSARLARTKLGAPSLSMRLSVPKLVPAVARQLELAQVLSGATVNIAADNEIPVLIAELSAELGEEHVGTLELCDSHRPEAKSKLSPALAESPAATSVSKQPRLRKTEPSFAELPGAPTRLLPEPCELHGPLRVGSSLAIERSLYTIDRLRFEQRLDAVEWWGHAPVTRDYVRLWLQGASGGFEAVAFVDRSTGRRYLQALAD